MYMPVYVCLCSFIYKTREDFLEKECLRMAVNALE